MACAACLLYAIYVQTREIGVLSHGKTITARIAIAEQLQVTPVFNKPLQGLWQLRTPTSAAQRGAPS